MVATLKKMKVNLGLPAKHAPQSGPESLESLSMTPANRVHFASRFENGRFDSERDVRRRRDRRTRLAIRFRSPRGFMTQSVHYGGIEYNANSILYARWIADRIDLARSRPRLDLIIFRQIDRIIIAGLLAPRDDRGVDNHARDLRRNAAGASTGAAIERADVRRRCGSGARQSGRRAWRLRRSRHRASR